MDVTSTLRFLLDRALISEVVTSFAVHADQRNWQGLRACFTAELDFDYTSLNGGTPAHLQADQLIEAWRGVLSGFQATQHIVTNQIITLNGNEATCMAYLHAQHYLPNETGEATWTLGGYYNFLLVRNKQEWKICSVTLTATWAKGNRHLMTLAQERFSQL